MEMIRSLDAPRWRAQRDERPLARPVDRSALDLQASAVIFEGARRLSVGELELSAPEASDLVIDVEWSGVSTGTERLLWSGDMPPFPGLGYPLVPGYEAVGSVIWCEADESLIGRRVFAPGARCFKGARGLFGASASRIVVPVERAVPIDFVAPEEAVLLALAATAHHAVVAGRAPELIIGHGVLGRLIARVTMALGHPPPNVWEIDPARADGDGYAVMDPECDGRTDYRSICDVSGASDILDELVAHLAPQGEITLAGFYCERPSFSFPPAFMKEMRLRIAAEWKRPDLDAVIALHQRGALSLDGLITHRAPAVEADAAYRTAFEDSACLKMVLDWRNVNDRSV